ncbi:MAG TPA: deoxyribose-phosphate aldolase [Oscillospiraceae bacterium]|nr:deoxyribose-phosphate aldolase [Oscillospiraceae bacterium]
MEIREILERVDHTLLQQTATWEEVKALCDEAMRFKTASVCIPASFVARASAYCAGRMKICTVVGFPNGYSTTAAKVFEAEDALGSGADEIDMVVDLGDVKDGAYDRAEEEIRAVKAACGGHVLKVIVETCLLTEAEKIELCGVVSRAGADYIKTSTGFSTGGATRGDVALFRKHLAPEVKIKASGGVRTFRDAADFIALGADRVGASALVKLAMEGKTL